MGKKTKQRKPTQPVVTSPVASVIQDSLVTASLQQPVATRPLETSEQDLRLLGDMQRIARLLVIVLVAMLALSYFNMHSTKLRTLGNRVAAFIRLN